MSFARTCLCTLMLIGVSASFEVAAEESTPNAALAYWQAFATLPTTNKEQDEVLSQVTSPLDKHAAALIEKGQGSMKSFHRATAMPNCDWGLEFSAGPHMVMPHLSKARQMARFAALHARKQFADGNQDAALETLGDLFVMTRHTGGDSVLISLLVQYAIESMTFELTAYHLLDLDDAQLDRLSHRLDSLPKGGSIRQSLELEQEIYIGWARRVIREAEGDTEAVRQLRDVVAGGDDAESPVPEVTREQIAGWLDETWKDYEEIQQLYDLPSDEFEERWKKLQDRIKDTNPFSNLVLPGLKRIREVSDKQTAAWALFRAAIAVARDGVDSLASVKDPFGDGPFKYTKLAGGFRLTSQYKFRGEPVELTVGKVEDK